MGKSLILYFIYGGLEIICLHWSNDLLPVGEDTESALLCHFPVPSFSLGQLDL